MLEELKKVFENSKDVFFRKVEIQGESLDLIFSDAMTDSNLISNYVIRSFEEIVLKDKNPNNSLREKINNNINGIELDKKLAINKIKKIESNDIEEICTYIFSGFTIVIYLNNIYAIETKANLFRSISEPSSENSIRGARDSFVENIMTNLGLIRNRIKTDKLVYKELEIGRKSKTKIGISYIENVAKKELVDYVENRLKQIDIDAILDINYIQEYIEEENDSDFPISINTERPDIVSYYLLQGRISILVNNCPYVLVLPAFFEDYINNIDDLYQKSKNVTLTKIIRYVSLVLTIIIPALYLSLITFDQETIPTILLKSFASQRSGVPFPAFIEAALMITAFEILKETDMRANKTSGNTLSIVGALILGDAAVSAGVVSPIMIIVVAITTISGLMFSDINVVNALRKWRIIYMILASMCGLIGIGIATIFFVSSLVSTTSYTLPFTYPIAPLNITEMKKNILSRIKISKDKTRQKILTDNIVK